SCSGTADLMLLRVQNLSVEYRSVGSPAHAVNDVSFSVDAGEAVAVVGESGSGKTTVALATLALARPGGQITGGSIEFEGRQLLGQPEKVLRTIRGHHIALITQSPRGSLNPVMHVGDQVKAVIRAHSR